MRNISFDAIKDTALRLRTYFGPFTDGSVILTNDEYLARGANGSFAHVPVLITDVNDEGSLFVEPYSDIYPNATADSVANTVVCGDGMCHNLTQEREY
jgi:carboxylesterase type B